MGGLGVGGFLASAAFFSSCAKLKHGGFRGITTKTVEGKGRIFAADPTAVAGCLRAVLGCPHDAIGSSRLFRGCSVRCLKLTKASRPASKLNG